MTPSNQANTPQLSEQLKSDTMNDDAMIGPDDAEPVEAGQDEQKSEDPLDKFLPPPPKAKCSEELQVSFVTAFEYYQQLNTILIDCKVAFNKLSKPLSLSSALV